MPYKLNQRRWWPPTGVALAVAAASGFLIPIQVVNGIPSAALSILRYMAFAAIWVCFPAQPHPRRDAQIARWLLPLAALAVILGPVSALRDDRQTLLLALNLGVSIGAALILARRPTAVRPLLVGFLAGAGWSAMTVAMQAAGLPALASDSWASNRNPGLAGSSLIVSWQLAIAVIIGIFLFATSQLSWVLRLLLVGVIALCVTALGFSGSQGGIVGLVAAAGVVAAHTWRPKSTPRMLLTIAAVAMSMGVGLTVAINVGAPTFAGFGEFDLSDDATLENERARVEVAGAAVDAIRENPLRGQSMESFRDAHTVSPHFFPLSAGVPLGITGVLLASLPLIKLLRTTWAGPQAPGPSPKLGVALLGLFTVYALVEPVGPFVSIGRLPILVCAGLACAALSTYAELGVDRPETPDEPSSRDHGEPSGRVEETSGL